MYLIGWRPEGRVHWITMISGPRDTPRRPLLVGLGVAVFCSLAFIASAFVATLLLTAPVPVAIGAPPPSLAGAEQVAISSGSGSRLQGWWLSSTNRNAAIILLHGIRANRTVMIDRARVLQDHGFAVLLFDFQAHGESPGTRITFGHREALDAIASVDFVKSRLPQARLGVIGQSLGGAAVLLAPKTLPVDAIVLESVYPDIDSALANRLSKYLGGWIGSALTSILSPGLRVLLPATISVNPEELRPIDRISSAGAPVLVMSGTADRNTTIAETRALFERAREPKTLREVIGAAHVDLESFDSKGYWQAVHPFLAATLK